MTYLSYVLNHRYSISISFLYKTIVPYCEPRPRLKHVEAETKWPPFSKRHFQMHFLEWNFLIKISLKNVLKGPINNIPIDNNPSLVHIMAWSRLGDKPLSEPMMVSLLANVCVTRSQWVLCLLSVVSQTMWPYNEYSLHVDNKKCYSISVVISHIKSI